MPEEVEDLREMSPVEAWIPDAAAQVASGLLRFARTFSAFLTRPAHTAAEWASGSLTLMNPLGFVATAAGFYWAVVNSLATVWPLPGTPAGIGDQVASAVGPQVHYALLGVTFHLALRALGSGRRMDGSVGVSFYVGGSTGLLVATLMAGVARYFAFARGTADLHVTAGEIVPLGLLTAAVLSYSAVLLALSRAMLGLHRTPVWKAVVAGAFAVLVTALVFGSVLPGGGYGWHPYITASPTSATFAIGFRG